MVSREDILDHLKLDKNYEDKLVYDIGNYLLENINNLNIEIEAKEKIKLNLSLIMDDSLRHGFLFSQLADYVLNNGKDKF